MNVDDLNWAAGMFEGEGTINIGTYRRSPEGEDYYQLQCKVPNTDDGIIDFFSAHWPKCSTRPERVRGDRQPQRKWIVSGVNAVAFLLQLGPHLRTNRVKQKRNVALQLHLLKKLSKDDPGNREKYLDEQRGCYDEMKQLNLRGAAANRRKHKG
jgi:hypothetical protein